MRRILQTLAVTAGWILVAGAAQAQSTEWYLLLEGQTGSISSHSGTPQSGLTNQTKVLSYGQNLFRPLDGSGSPGALQFRPLRVLKLVDGSSPRIAEAIATSEAITNCVLTLYQLGAGAPTALYEMVLTDAQVIGAAGGGMGSGSGGLGGTETVSILFQSATLTHLASGQTTTIP